MRRGFAGGSGALLVAMGNKTVRGSFVSFGAERGALVTRAPTSAAGASAAAFGGIHVTSGARGRTSKVDEGSGVSAPA
jgi:hypothetical protein